MLPVTAHISGRGQMTVMERVFAAGSAGDFSAEDAAREKQILLMLQRELAEADEANLLDEEDMHVFDREPLADRLMLVSCNTCKKPIKSSQYIVHAERCRSLLNSDESPLELDGGTGHRRPPRKARKKLLSPQNNYYTPGDTDRSQSLEGDDLTPDSAIAPGSNSESQIDRISGSGFHQTPKKLVERMDADTMAVTEDCDGVGLSNMMYSDDPTSPSKRAKMNERTTTQSTLAAEELDEICGVSLSDYVSCRQPLTCKAHSESLKRAVFGRSQPYDLLLNNFKLRKANDLRRQEQNASETVIPAPLATKVYYFRHHHQMRAVIGHLFREALTRASSVSGTIPVSASEEESTCYGVSQHVPADIFVQDLEDRTLSLNQKKNLKQKDTKVFPSYGNSNKPIHLLPQDIGISSVQLPTPRPSKQQQENTTGHCTLPTDIGQPAVLRSRAMQASQSLAISSPGSLNSLQLSPLGSVHVT